jgi:serine/threonine protein phosphatase PrpC
LKTCPQCTAEAPVDDRFCEECGAHLGSPSNAPRDCGKCGAGTDEIDGEGFCSACGFRREAPMRDHFEHAVSAGFAGITDRGLRHHRNEDFFAMDSAGDAHLIVVCDGVSSTSEADKGSEAAVDAIFRALVQGSAVREAIAKGQTAIAAIDGEPATTVVAAVVRDSRADIAWVGDSRAYWIARDGSTQLTSDDSWLNEVVSAGEISQEEALQSGQAHAITRWLGADATPEDSAASVVEFNLPGPGYLLLCSDGLWNYVPDAAAMAELVYARDETDTRDAVEVVRSLVEFANAKGGQDNITAVLLSL